MISIINVVLVCFVIIFLRDSHLKSPDPATEKKKNYDIMTTTIDVSPRFARSDSRKRRAGRSRPCARRRRRRRRLLEHIIGLVYT